jgi:hypothetical protein
MVVTHFDICALAGWMGSDGSKEWHCQNSFGKCLARGRSNLVSAGKLHSLLVSSKFRNFLH